MEKITLQLKSGAALEQWQIESIWIGNAGNRASVDQVREYLSDEGWEAEDIEEFIEKTKLPTF